jgi:hypothetical protein
MHLYNCIWVVLLISMLNLAFLSPKLSRDIDKVLVCLCTCGFDNPRNTLRWKLLQLAFLRFRIILLGLRTANTCHGQRQLGSAIYRMTWQWHHATININSTALAWLGSDITPHQHWLSSAITSNAQQHHYQHDSAVTSRHCKHKLDNAITSMTRGLERTSSTNNPTWRFTTNLALGLNSGTRLPTSPILNRGEHVVTNKIMVHFIKLAKSYT